MNQQPKEFAAGITSYGELSSALRARAAEIGVTRETLDHLAKLPSGYCGHLFSEKPTRYFGIKSLAGILRTLGLRITLVEDQESLARTLRLMGKRRSEPQACDGVTGPCHWRTVQHSNGNDTMPTESIVDRLRAALANIEAVMGEVSPAPGPTLTVIPGGKTDERANG